MTLTHHNIIDADGHILEPADTWERYIEPAYRERALRIREHEGKEVLELDGKPSRFFDVRVLTALGAMGKDAEELAGRLSGVVVNVKRKVSEGDVLYGSVTAADIAEVLAEEGFEISKDQIDLDHPIKALGGHEIALNLPYGVEAAIKLWVVKDEEE